MKQEERAGSTRWFTLEPSTALRAAGAAPPYAGWLGPCAQTAALIDG